MNPVTDAREFWNFSYAEMGKYDAPVNLNFVKEQIGPKPLTYIGYAEGATSILYGMSLKDKAIYFNQLLTEVVILAPCVFLNEPITTIPSTGQELNISEQLYKSYERAYDYYDQVGVYAYNGPDSEADVNKLCYIFGEKSLECRDRSKPSGFGQPFSVKAQQHLK